MPSVVRNKSKYILLWTLVIMLGCIPYSPSIAGELNEQSAEANTAENSKENNKVGLQEKEKSKTFSGGNGTAKKPFLISSKKDLLDLAGELTKTANPYKNYHYKLTKDIDLGSTEWVSMCYTYDKFSGVFDGDGHRITIKNIAADGRSIGFFRAIDTTGVVKNLIIKSSITQKLSSKDGLSFGLIAGVSDGIIKNCTVEGTISLTVSAPQDIAIGAVVGRISSSISDIQNKATLNVSKSGVGFLLCGGIIGSGRDSATMSPSNMTNNGHVVVKSTGAPLSVGGIIGEFIGGKKLYNVLNNGNVSVSTSKIGDKRAVVGGIVGSIRESAIDRAINRKKIYSEFTGKPGDEELLAGGIAGSSHKVKYTNVGNEGNVECYSGRVGIAAGIIGASNAYDSINNAYNSGAIFAHTDYTNNSKNKDYYEIYSHGLIGGNPAEVKNFYNKGKITNKQANKATENGEAFANIRPSESTKSFNYCYWSSNVNPFPPLQKAADTTSAFNTDSGKLSKSITIGSKSYSNLTDALNAWIDNQKDKKSYVKWSGKGTPGFTEAFGYTSP